MRPSDVRRYRRHLARELDNVALYRSLAQSTTGEHRDVLLQLAAAEERHAQYWSAKLGALGVKPEDAAHHRPRLSARSVSWLGRRLGVRRVVPLLERLEAGERTRYDTEPGVGTAMAADETVHAQLVASLAPAWRTRASSSFRAAVFGINDGLVSNLSLVMGMAGGKASTTVVLLAGVAGLVAGAGSMAAGEYISVRSQAELLEAAPPGDVEEPTGSGDRQPVAVELLASRTDKQRRRRATTPTAQAPGATGSPVGAAASSFAAFAVGASVPLLPFIVAEGAAALVAAAVLAGVALFVVGAGISILTNRPAVTSGLRQLLVGALAATGTYLVGLVVGTSLL